MTNKKIHELRGKCWHDFDWHSPGWFCKHKCNSNYNGFMGNLLPEQNPDYLNNIADAMELLSETDTWILSGGARGLFHCFIRNYDTKDKTGKQFESFGKTPMKAICKAFKAWKGKK